ncbi:adenine DNA glycosylase [Aristolochia californica]|uniref:adenine DNA glycosylase n=1 Tax=Aristolochia californica TaxID=171875 RepID=UPI0035D627D7
MEKEEKKKRKRSVVTACNQKKDAVCNEIAAIEDFSKEETLKIRASLLRWYYENQRVLPWRINQCEVKNDSREETEARAYAVWVSEVMLQQTQVVTVVDYYNRWMTKWPTVHHLAQASQEEVNEMWAGLGYYRRARFLLEGAKSIVEGGEFPKTASALRSVRGIGDYTAGAIASIAFREAVPVVDGNVIRVVARLKAISENPREAKTIKNFWKLAGQLVDPSRPGDFNQALMELGATLCTPANPTCSVCPVSDQCQALKISRKSKSILVTDFPTKVVKARQRLEFAAVCVVEITGNPDLETWKTGKCRTNGLLLVKRPEEGLLAGLWEFPSALLKGEEADSNTRRKAIDQYLKDSFELDIKKNGKLVLREDVGEYVHVFSHIRLRMYIELLVLYLEGGAGALRNKEIQTSVTWKCSDDESIKSMGLTSGVRKVYNMVMDFKENGVKKNSSKTRRVRSN